jgi:hypothetical protein
VSLDESRVHAVQVGGKQGCFVAAGTGTDLDDSVARVQWVLRYERRLELRFQLGDRRLEALDLRARFGRQLRVVNGNEVARLRELALLLPKAGCQLYERREPAMLAAQLGQFLSVPDCLRRRQRALDFRRPRERLGEAIAKAQLCFPYLVRNRSTRPAVSTSFCLPVKNGWQTLQMSV